MGTEENPKKYVKLIGTSFKVPTQIFARLFPYQRDALKWMFSLSPHAPKGLSPERPIVSHGALRELASEGNQAVNGGILGDDVSWTTAR